MSDPSFAAEVVPARAGLPFDADDQEPARDGRLHRSDPTEPAGQVCGPAGFNLRRPRACPRAERLDRPPRGATAALKRPAAGSDRNEKKGSRHGSDIGRKPAGNDMSKPASFGKPQTAGATPPQPPWVHLSRYGRKGGISTKFEFVDDLLLQCQPMCERIEFAHLSKASRSASS
ncbi:hypothetical protein ASD54_23680 [Rhizobium sp. Root149]|uniref:hypothetical protein n=1 Tax=Rhizobium TaxID=379 RepID=UPI00071316C9|nr:MULTISPECIES: hypothetical protein [Rhizobium]KQZ59779.1 hypothetical protein ASD54_23680 [Rhizobium sp. Root149]